MAVPPAGSVLLDGVPFELAKGEGGRGWAWNEHLSAILPGLGQPEEPLVSRAPPGYLRTLAWLDFTGQGQSRKRAGDSRLHYSDGPTGEHPGRLVRGHEVRTVVPANGGGSVTHFKELNSRLYAVIGPTIRRITLTLNAETVAARATDGVANGDATGVYVSGVAAFTEGSPLWYDGAGSKVFFGTSDATDFLVSFDGTATWAQDADVAAGYFALSQGTDGQRLWAGAAAGDTAGVYVWNLPQGANPFTIGSWSSKFTLGQRAHAITAMAALRDAVIVTTAAGQVFRLDYASGLATPLLDDDGLVPDTASGERTGVWNGQLVVPTPRGLALYEEQADAPGIFRAIGPEHLRGHEAPFRGPCTATYCGDPAYLWAAFYNGTDSYVEALRHPYLGEQTGGARLVMDTGGVGKIAAVKVTALHVTQLGTNPVLCIGTNVPDVRFVTLPRQMRSVLEDSNCRSAVGATSVVLADQDGGAPTTPKTFWTARFKTKGMTSSEKLTVFRRCDRGSWEQTGVVDSSPFKIVRLGTGCNGGELGLRLDWSGADNTLFPQLEGVEVDCKETPEPARWIDVTLYLARGQHTASGQSERPPREQLEVLYDLMKGLAVFAITGPDGAEHTGQIDPAAGIHPQMVEALPDHGVAYLVPLRLNVYSSLVSHPAAVYGVDVYSTSVRKSYYA